MGEIITRPGPKGLRYYVRYVDADGRRKMKKAPGEGLPKSDAEKAARRFLAGLETRIANGKVGIVEPTREEKERASITFQKLADRFLTDYASPKIKDLEEYRTQARSVLKVRLLPTLKARTVASIRPHDVEKLRDAQIADNYAPGSIDATLRTLSRIFSWGRKAGLIDCDNPVLGIERPEADDSIDYLDAVEVGKLLAHAEEHAPDLYPMIAAAIYTGMRKGELFGLRWRDLDLDARRLTVARSYRLAPKSGKTRHLRIHPELAPVLRVWRDRCPKTEEGLVFPVQGAGGRWRMGERPEGLGLDALLADAGVHVPAKPWHACRHTFASHFIMKGGNILTLQRLLGHATVEMTMIYAHLAPDFMDAEISRLEFRRPSTTDVADLGAARRERGA